MADSNEHLPAPYYQDDAVTLYHGDCRELIPAIRWAHGPAALVLADPPYGDTSLEWDRWPDGWVAQMVGAARQVWCFGSFRMFLDHGREFTDADWRLGQEVVWEKHNGSSFHADRFKRVHELAVHWYRGQWSTLTLNPQAVAYDGPSKAVRKRGNTPHTGAIGDTGYVDNGTRLVRSVIFARSCQGSAIHPTEKPVGILEPLIRYSTNPGDLIIDPFGGSCSTARAARALGRRAICIEAREEYLAAAVEALNQGQLDLVTSATCTEASPS